MHNKTSKTNACLEVSILEKKRNLEFQFLKLDQICCFFTHVVFQES